MPPNICLDGRVIAKDIKDRCQRRGRTVKDVFREAKVSYRTYVSWQQGENNPSFPLLRKVYDVLNKKVTA